MWETEYSAALCYLEVIYLYAFLCHFSGTFSHIQRSPVLKKKDSFEDLISIHIHKSRSILLGRIIGELGKKRKLHILSKILICR